ncbi:MAG: TIGR04283 family arsenosugar biosynthesis glycosyltransferase [Planctomycetaceae bacterium]|nr:TIGR04283 family arsenosugar biosynthesis glycosyltransferase [Planctomycetaceae bacterium]
MRLSIIIPALNEAENIFRAVDSAWRAGAAEVIVIDGGSSDQTPAIAASLRCRLFSSPPGRAVQQNLGAQAATGDVLLFLHADNYLAGDIATQVSRCLIDPHRLHGALKQRIDGPGLAYRLLERGNASRVRRLGLPYGDQAIFVRREAFLALGGFPDQPLLEDVLLMRQLRRQAWPALAPGPVVVSARRWQKHGVLGQTLRNWWLLARHACGASPAVLAGHYRRHDDEPEVQSR